MTKRKLFFTALTTIGLALANQSTFASTITVSFAGSANFGAGGVGYYNGSVAPNPNSTSSLVGVGIGGDSFTTSNHTFDFSTTGQFNTWCVDIYHWLRSGTYTYNVGVGADLAASLDALRPGTPSGTTRVNQLLLLANDVYSTVDTKVESAAFQLAVWAITYGIADVSGKYQIDTTNAGFRVDTTTAASNYGLMANTWLSNLGTVADTGNYKLTYLHDNSEVQENRTPNTQDMVVFTPTPVPEPATYGLFAIALLGLAMGRRKQVGLPI